MLCYGAGGCGFKSRFGLPMMGKISDNPAVHLWVSTPGKDKGVQRENGMDSAFHMLWVSNLPEL